MVQSFRSVKTPTTAQARPFHFVGNEELIQRFIGLLDDERLPKAVLFCGPRSLGKATFAQWVIQYALCHSDHLRPCGTCSDCRQRLSHQHPNVAELGMTSAASIGVEEIRTTLRTYMTVAWGSEERWLFIPDAERLTEQAGNMLLKFLEELPPHVRVLMTSSVPEQLLPTLRSRLTHFQWSLVNPKTLRQGATSVAAQRAAGRPGWLRRYVENVDQAADERQRVREFSTGFMNGTLSAPARSAADRRDILLHQLEYEELIVREVLLAGIGCTTRRLWPEETVISLTRLPLKKLQRIAEAYLQRSSFSDSLQPQLLYDDLHMV